ncbi:MAG TPA: spheroidene monooxygenase, partial [Phnomibacter sp.]|nr:spheroidene monooxygenase [Phnomibacter sp.]
LGAFVAGWLKIFGRHTKAYLLQPEEGHGLWNGRQVFGPVPKQANFTGPVAVLTRASIKITKLRRFWQHVGPVARQMASAPGFITSYGVGEVPFTKQATFSIWQSKAQMKAFAYQMQQHKEVVAKTRKEKWYSEDLFMRFSIIDEVETIH